jgi:hypothetical protein
MAKKQRVSEAIQNKFNKPQFKPGDAVYFVWLGQKLYGHVRKTKQTGWGIQYMVETHQKRRYPCGIQISGFKTEYNIGYIFFEETRSIGNDECANRITAPATYIGVHEESGRTTGKGGTDLKGSRRNDVKDSAAIKPDRKKRLSKSNDAVPSSTGNDGNGTTKRKAVRNTELDSAIEKQRNFLSGFIKKD